jgi:outer membrane lipoprotein-sorting protein
MISFAITILLISTSFQSSFFIQSDPEALRIIQKVEDQMRGNSSEGRMTMSIIRPDFTRNISMKTWSLGEEYGITLITAPARERGMAFLKRGREVWNWQPSIDRTIKMPPSMMSQGWMGSDLTTDDLVRQNSIINDYVHKMLPEVNHTGISCYAIELTPKNNAAVVWGKIIMYISKQDYLQYQVRFFDENMQLVNTMNGAKPKTFGKRRMLTEMEVVPSNKPNQKTVIIYEDLKFDVPLKPDFFSIQNLKNLRG